MKRKERGKKPDNRIVMYKTLDQEKRLDAYCLAVMNRKGKVISGLKPLILEKAAYQGSVVDFPHHFQGFRDRAHVGFSLRLLLLAKV
jgi:hypothetical protein